MFEIHWTISCRKIKTRGRHTQHTIVRCYETAIGTRSYQNARNKIKIHNLQCDKCSSFLNVRRKWNGNSNETRKKTNETLVLAAHAAHQTEPLRTICCAMFFVFFFLRFTCTEHTIKIENGRKLIYLLLRREVFSINPFSNAVFSWTAARRELPCNWFAVEWCTQQPIVLILLMNSFCHLL